MSAPDPLSVVFAALSDPTRRAILSRLRAGPSTVGDLASPFAMSKPAVSQHLRVLEAAGLIERHSRAQWRTCTLRTEPLNAASDWIGVLRAEWTDRLDLLDARLREIHPPPGSLAGIPPEYDGSFTKGSSIMADGTETETNPFASIDHTQGFAITRTVQAPPEVVWREWTDPDEATHWYHPRGLVTPRESVSMDVREGGTYRYTMRTEDGQEYPTGGTYLEVKKPHRLKFTWGQPDDPVDAAMVVTITLEPDGAQGERTNLTFELAGAAGAPGDDSFFDGWASALDMLEERLDEV